MFFKHILLIKFLNDSELITFMYLFIFFFYTQLNSLNIVIKYE